jgi:uncharacterized surface protein with fasciclin (FAS1) repeats
LIISDKSVAMLPMPTPPRARRRLLACLLLPALLAACGGGDPAVPASERTSAPAPERSSPEPSPSASASASPSVRVSESERMSEAAAPQTLEELPLDGLPGSLAVMVNQPMGTAAAGNPFLTTWSAALAEVGLAEMLDGPGPFTVFAPVDDAFAALPQEELDALLGDPERLAELLTAHVVEGEALLTADLAVREQVPVVSGATLSVIAADETLDLNGGQATVLIPDIRVTNGFLHLIDGVLAPPERGVQVRDASDRARYSSAWSPSWWRSRRSRSAMG